jgi:hypothetical protein
MFVLNKKGELCRKHPGAGRPVAVNETELKFQWMKEKGLSLDETESELFQLKQTLAEPEQENVSDSLIRVIERHDIFKTIKIFVSSKVVLVWQKGLKTVLIGSYDSLNARKMDTILSEHDSESYGQFIEDLAPLLCPKNPLKVSGTECLDFAINHLKRNPNIPRIELSTEDILPTLVQTVNLPSLYKIPFEQTQVEFTQLNSYLQDFLLRVDNHKHLCAIIWGQFTGRQWPYICYLYGKDGREGKTLFINMVGKLSKSFANLTDDSRFSIFSLYGKSIILVPENDKARLMSSKTIKAITGGSLLAIEEKGKTAFSGNILGTIMVDANLPLKISGKNFETDRLRYFTVKTHGLHQDKRLGPSQYLAEISSTPNEFLNYCRQCCEELETDLGMLREPENHEEIMLSLGDYEQDYEYNLIFDKLKRDSKLQVREDLSIGKAELLSKAKLLYSDKRNFFSQSFIFYLEKKGIVSDNKVFKGIGYVSDGHTSFVKTS